MWHTSITEGVRSTLDGLRKWSKALLFITWRIQLLSIFRDKWCSSILISGLVSKLESLSLSFKEWSGCQWRSLTVIAKGLALPRLWTSVTTRLTNSAECQTQKMSGKDCWSTIWIRIVTRWRCAGYLRSCSITWRSVRARCSRSRTLPAR